MLYYSNFRILLLEPSSRSLSSLRDSSRFFAILCDSSQFFAILYNSMLLQTIFTAIAVLLSCTSPELSIYQMAKFEQRHLAKVIKNIINHNITTSCFFGIVTHKNRDHAGKSQKNLTS